MGVGVEEAHDFLGGWLVLRALAAQAAAPHGGTKDYGPDTAALEVGGQDCDGCSFR